MAHQAISVTCLVLLLQLLHLALGRPDATLASLSSPYGPPKHKQQQPHYVSPKQQPHYAPPKHGSPYKEEPKPYAFDYGVRDDYSGAAFGHQEASDGNAIQGSYTVQLPDGRIQKVKYVADHFNGFQAEVSYEGEATYPEHKPQQPQYSSAPSPYHQPKPKAKSKPIYSAPQPAYASDHVASYAPQQLTPVFNNDNKQGLNLYPESLLS